MAQEYKTEDKYEMVPYDETQLNEKLENLQGWERVDESPLIARTYKFDKYLDGVKFANKIGEYAQKRKHHPTIVIDFHKVTVKTTSWSVKGVTELDIEMVHDFDAIYNDG